MKAYKLEILVIDHDECGEEEICGLIENANYPNDAISPKVKSVKCVDIGEWSDDHPLNNGETYEDEYTRIFP